MKALALFLGIFLICGMVGATTCTNNWVGGKCNGNITYDTSTSLTSTVNTSKNLIINSGVTLTTGGYSIILGGTLTNNGIIKTGQQTNFGAGGVGNNNGGVGGSLTSSFAGSGGGGGGGIAFGKSGGKGGNTIANAGAGGAPSNIGGNGLTQGAPTIDNANIITWYGGITTYLSGGGGGGGAGSIGVNGGAGTGGAFGLYIQANNIIAGVINSNALKGANGGLINLAGSGGGGGGGLVIIAYKDNYTSGTYNFSGGVGGTQAFKGGKGGNGNVLTYQYVTPPIPYYDAIETATISDITGSATIYGGFFYKFFQATWTHGTAPYTANYLLCNSITNTVLTSQLYTGITGLSNSLILFIPNTLIGNTIYANVVITDSYVTNAIKGTAYTGSNSVIAVPTTSTTSTSTSTTTTSTSTTTYTTTTSTTSTSTTVFPTNSIIFLPSEWDSMIEAIFCVIAAVGFLYGYLNDKDQTFRFIWLFMALILILCGTFAGTQLTTADTITTGGNYITTFAYTNSDSLVFMGNAFAVIIVLMIALIAYRVIKGMLTKKPA